MYVNEKSLLKLTAKVVRDIMLLTKVGSISSIARSLLYIL